MIIVSITFLGSIIYFTATCNLHGLEWKLEASSNFIFFKLGCLFMHESHMCYLLACFLQVGFNIMIAIITMYPIVIKPWVYYFSAISKLFWNLHDSRRHDGNGIFYLPIHSLWQIIFRVQPLFNVVWDIRIFLSHNKKSYNSYKKKSLTSS